MDFTGVKSLDLGAMGIDDDDMQDVVRLRPRRPS